MSGRHRERTPVPPRSTAPSAPSTSIFSTSGSSGAALLVPGVECHGLHFEGAGGAHVELAGRVTVGHAEGTGSVVDGAWHDGKVSDGVELAMAVKVAHVPLEGFEGVDVSLGPDRPCAREGVEAHVRSHVPDSRARFEALDEVSQLGALQDPQPGAVRSRAGHPPQPGGGTGENRHHRLTGNQTER